MIKSIQALREICLTFTTEVECLPISISLSGNKLCSIKCKGKYGYGGAVITHKASGTVC